MTLGLQQCPCLLEELFQFQSPFGEFSQNGCKLIFAGPIGLLRPFEIGLCMFFIVLLPVFDEMFQFLQIIHILLLMFVEQEVRMPVLMGGQTMIVDMLMNEIYPEKEVLILQDLLRGADLFNPVFLRQEGDPCMEFVDE
jgi:hypothetical protein